ncbi:putative signal transducing protein [Lacinutrix chionoecetis]
MTDSEYIKIYTGNTIVVQIIKQRLEDIGINPVIKDETESGRLAGFGATLPGQPEIYVHESETDKAVRIVETVRGEMEAD